MTYHLFLDDERIPEDVFWVELPRAEWVVVRDYDEFVDTITREGIPAHISFDNDLGEDKLEGRHCAKWLIEYILDHHPVAEFTFTVHSMNPVAAVAIEGYLSNFFAWRKSNFFAGIKKD